MNTPRWRKVLGDLFGNKTRTALVVLSIAVGIFAVGMIAGSYVIIERDMTRSFDAVNAADAAIYTDGFDDAFADSMRHVPGVRDAQGRLQVTVRAQLSPTDTRNLALMSIPDHGAARINQVKPLTGAWPPATKEIALERASMVWLGLKEGDRITVETSDNKLRELRVVGTAYFMNLPPPMFGGSGYGFASLDTLEWLGAGRQYNELQIVVDRAQLNKPHIEDVAARVRDRVEASGRKVYYTYIPDPGKYPADDAVRAILMLLGVLGVLSLLLSGFLVVNTVSALLAQQTRQIGVMKALGARTTQVTGMYLATVLGFGTLSLLVGVPLGVLACYSFTRYMANLINFDVQSYLPPWYVFGIQAVVGLAVPVLAALWPVIAGTRVTVREALNTEGIAKLSAGRGLIDRVVGSIHGLSRPLLISLRNTFRRKGRLALTLSTLTLGGAIFIAVLSVWQSTTKTLDDALAYFNYDVEVTLNRAYRAEQVQTVAELVPGVADSEVLAGDVVRRVRPGPDKVEGNNVMLLALPANTTFIRPTLLEGRWLLPADENAVVVNTTFLTDEPDVKLGDRITFKLNSKETTWQVVGIVRGVMTGSMVYTNQPYYWHLTNNPGRGQTLWVVGTNHDPAAQSQLAKALEAQFKASGMRVQQTQTISFIRQTVQSQFDIVVVLLLVMAVLLAVVGGLGLMGTMSLNVLERTREIGVMRAIGASNGAIRQIFIVEGVLIGILSWLIGSLLALPASRLLSDQFGIAFIQTPLSYVFSLFGVGLWLGVVVVLATLASILPARAASRLTIRDVLAYE
ncbi:MAG TPA: FtsX-like permease family protein [Chloroflexota bacterium]|nr:FtsX-like permease family protein [Chloroflexota bacterium]